MFAHGIVRLTACMGLLFAVSCPRGVSLSPSNSFTQYGYDLNNSQNNRYEKALGQANVATLHELWRLRVPDGATSVPVVMDGTVYFGSWNGHFYAVDAKTGEIVWDHRLTPRFIRSTALVLEDRVYVAAGINLVALDRKTGDSVFESELDNQLTTLLDASPKSVDGLIIVGVAHFENTLPQADYTTRGALIALDAQSGEEVWRVYTTGDQPGPCTGGAGSSVWSSVAIDPDLGLAYVGTGQSFEEPSSTCNDSLLAVHYARDHRGERIAWKQNYKREDVYTSGMRIDGTDADVGASPNLFEIAGRPAVGVGNKGGSFRVFDRRDGELIWQKDLKVGVPPVSTGLGGVMTTAAVSGDTLYVASNAFTVGSIFTTGEHDPHDTAVLYALDTASGAERWTLDVPAPMVGGLTIASDVLYHTTIAGKLYARALATGKPLLALDLDANLGAAPSVSGGRLFVSAGMVINGGFQDPRGAFIAGFGVGANAPSVERDAPPDVLEALSAEQCHAALVSELIPSAACGDCLCACDASAAGHCDVCFALASCTAKSCASAAAGEEMRSCMSTACGTKLLPTFLFDRAVDIGPCVVRCAESCGF